MNSEFENKVQSQPIREVPPHWRARIVAAAQPQPSRWREWFQPFPRAWGALGAAWVVIIALHFTTPHEPRFTGNSYAPQSFAILQEQTMMMAQLLGPTNADEKPSALPAEPKPRTERTRKELIG